MEHLFTASALVSLFTLTALEIVLGIDNIIFVAILVGKLPVVVQDSARRIGLSLALILRILLLLSIAKIAQLTNPWFYIGHYGFSGREIIMVCGGLFLIAKSTLEIHDKLEGALSEDDSSAKVSYFGSIVQIILLDLVFSLDSVITAIGLGQSIEIMVAAVIIAVMIMFVTAKGVSAFINRHPTIKMLALSFLLMVGLMLFLEGFGIHVPKEFIYSAMAFSVFVEFLNLRLRKKTNPVQLNTRFEENTEEQGK
ncbi:MAG: TerC family protein [Bacteroidetes bacterium]|nr:TerC family protein [Bacteroidota bacterium]